MTTRKKADSGLPDWLELLETDPISALEQVREDILEAEFVNDDTKQEAIGFIVECIRKASINPYYFSKLQQSSVFSDDELGSRKVSVVVARFVLDVTDVKGARYEKARSYGQLADYFAETDLSGEDVANRLRKHGIRNWLEHIQKIERDAVSQDGQVGTQLNENDHDDLLPTSGDAPTDVAQKEGRTSISPMPRGEIMKRALSKEPAAKVLRPKLNLETMLVSESPDHFLRRVLETPEGATVTITLLREPSYEGQDWKRFVIIEVGT